MSHLRKSIGVVALFILVISFISIVSSQINNQQDEDFDGVPNEFDLCPGTQTGIHVGSDGCPQRVSINDLPIIIGNLNVSAVEKSLLTKAQNAIKSVERGNVNSALNQLNALINEVQAQSGKKISENDAAFLIGIIRNIIDFYTLPTCCINRVTIDDTCFGATFEQCVALGGIVLQCVPSGKDEGRVAEPLVRAPVNLTPANLTKHRDLLENISRAFNASRIGVPPFGNGTYVNRTHDCDDFANETETLLQGLGFQATFTVFWCYTPPEFGHCVADIHLGDGSTLFISPYTGFPENLDFDGDGVVEARNNRVVRTPTDDNCAIEIYESAEAAVAAGVRLD